MNSDTTVAWGTGSYVNLTVGRVRQWHGHPLCVREVTERGCTLEVDGHPRALPFSRRDLPTQHDDLQLFCADTRPAAALTTDTFTRSRSIHGCLEGDALVCIAPAGGPLLPAGRFRFPVSRKVGFRWAMGEASHMFAYLGPKRSHEGIDLDMPPARDGGRYEVLALEPSRVVRLLRGRNGCAMLQSLAQPWIYYVFQHLFGPELLASDGQIVEGGQPLGWAWGDGRWEHLHLSVRHGDPQRPPSLNRRYDRLLNAFPQMYELYHGTAALRPVVHRQGDWLFGSHAYWEVHNQQLTSGYTPILGYGWELGPWCKPNCVEVAHSPVGRGDAAPCAHGVRLRRVLHKGTRAESICPESKLTFRVDVPRGVYRISLRCGDAGERSWQHLTCNGVELGTYDLAVGQEATTPVREVQAPEGMLRVDVDLPPDPIAARPVAIYFGASNIPLSK